MLLEERSLRCYSREGSSLLVLVADGRLENLLYFFLLSSKVSKLNDGQRPMAKRTRQEKTADQGTKPAPPPPAKVGQLKSARCASVTHRALHVANFSHHPSEICRPRLRTQSLPSCSSFYKPQNRANGGMLGRWIWLRVVMP